TSFSGALQQATGKTGLRSDVGCLTQGHSLRSYACLPAQVRRYFQGMLKYD
ncbi:MAG: hypothetical protein ACI8RU_000699, partial [Zhongshania aliphaticivorans]